MADYPGNRRSKHSSAFQSQMLHSSLSYVRLPDGHVAVRDLDFAAYCKLRGLIEGDPTCTAGGSTGPRRYLLKFHDPTDRIRQIGIDYLNSESAQHADLVRRIKRVCRVVSDAEFASSEMGGNSCRIK